ncbi:MAG: DUF438 domain-containing protein [Alteromonadaceae bacterium]|jgi:DUF438 domain-containing protein
MFNLILSILVPSSLAFVIAYSLFQKKHQQAQKKLQAQYGVRINNIKASFKSTMELYSLQRVIRPSNIKQLCAIVDNFFVDQSINEHNVRKLETLSTAIAITIAREFNLTKSDEDIEWLQKKLLNFTIKLPKIGKDYNQNFYQRKLKQLINGLNTTRANFVQSHAA